MNSLTNEQQKLYQNAKIYYICIEKFEDKHAKDKKYRKVRDHCHYAWEYTSAANSISNLRCSVPQEISTVFHDGYNYDCNFIIKELAEEFQKQFTCLGENTGKIYNLFSYNTKRSPKNS